MMRYLVLLAALTAGVRGQSNEGNSHDGQGECVRCGPGTVQVGHGCVGSHATCAGLDFPDHFVPHHPCQCNGRCKEFGNCCKDHESAHEATCDALGHPHSYNPKNPCQCNDRCMDFGNCCKDYQPDSNNAEDYWLEPTCAALGNPDMYVPQNPCQCNSLCKKHDNCCAEDRGSVCKEGVREGATYWDEESNEHQECSLLEFGCAMTDCASAFGGEHMMHMWSASTGCCHGNKEDFSPEDYVFKSKNPNADWDNVFNFCPLWGKYARPICPLGPDSCTRDPSPEELSGICSEAMPTGDEEDGLEDSCLSHIGRQGVGGYIFPHCNLDGCMQLVESPVFINSTCWDGGDDEAPTGNKNTCNPNCKETMKDVINECQYFDSIASVGRGMVGNCTGDDKHDDSAGGYGSGAPQDGAPQDGAPQDGAPQDGPSPSDDMRRNLRNAKH